MLFGKSLLTVSMGVLLSLVNVPSSYGLNPEEENDTSPPSLLKSEEPRPVNLEGLVRPDRAIERSSLRERCFSQLLLYHHSLGNYRGILKKPLKLDENTNLLPQRPTHSYGEEELIDALNFAACILYDASGAPLVIHDLSKRNGGKLRPHQSHRTGRDADVGYYAYNETDGYYNAFKSMRGHLNPDFNNPFALEANWNFVKALVDGPHEIECIFTDRKLSHQLQDYVTSTYGKKEWETYARFLKPAPGHHTHYHIRVKRAVLPEKV